MSHRRPETRVPTVAEAEILRAAANGYNVRGTQQGGLPVDRNALNACLAHHWMVLGYPPPAPGLPRKYVVSKRGREALALAPALPAVAAKHVYVPPPDPRFGVVVPAPPKAAHAPHKPKTYPPRTQPLNPFRRVL